MRTDFSRDGCATATKAWGGGGEVAADLSPTLRLGTPAPARNRRFHTDFGRKSIHGGRKIPWGGGPISGEICSHCPCFVMRQRWPPMAPRWRLHWLARDGVQNSWHCGVRWRAAAAAAQGACRADVSECWATRCEAAVRRVPAAPDGVHGLTDTKCRPCMASKAPVQPGERGVPPVGLLVGACSRRAADAASGLYARLAGRGYRRSTTRR